jgi:hypothetical protein
MPVVDNFTNNCVGMLPDKLSSKKQLCQSARQLPFRIPDNVRDRPLIFRLVSTPGRNNCFQGCAWQTGKLMPGNAGFFMQVRGS